MYVSSFYKAHEHDYEGFFSNYRNDEETLKAKAELNKLMKEVEEKTAAYSILLSKRYNDSFTPIETDVILTYEDRNGNLYSFDGITGFPYNKGETDARHVSLDTKTGTFHLVTGYCYPLGAAIVSKFSYSIPTNNSKVIIKRVYEVIVPMLENVAFRYMNDGTVEQIYATNGLSETNATEFIKNFYGIEDKHFPFSLHTMREYIKNNKSFEIVIRTCEDETLMKTLLKFNSDKACPIHELIGCSKADYNFADELGLLSDFVSFKQKLAQDIFYRKKEFTAAITKTDKEWIDFLDKIKHWTEDLNFYNIGYRSDLGTTLLKGYIGGDYPFYCTKLPHYYPFGKFCSYVVEESINQGYTSIETFIKTLGDYIRMCDDLDVTPTLYSRYLHQTHDIMARNHKIKLKEEQEKIFIERYKNFKPWNNKDYCIVHPENSLALQREGDTLNHCVASYIKRVVDGECLIYFLRHNNEPDKSLVTLEIRKNAIVQARGLHNRQINNEEHHALTEYCLKTGVMLRV